jgi:hypothetical protein
MQNGTRLSIDQLHYCWRYRTSVALGALSGVERVRTSAFIGHHATRTTMLAKSDLHHLDDDHLISYRKHTYHLATLGSRETLTPAELQFLSSMGRCICYSTCKYPAQGTLNILQINIYC